MESECKPLFPLVIILFTSFFLIVQQLDMKIYNTIFLKTLHIKFYNFCMINYWFLKSRNLDYIRFLKLYFNAMYFSTHNCHNYNWDSYCSSLQGHPCKREWKKLSLAQNATIHASCISVYFYVLTYIFLLFGVFCMIKTRPIFLYHIHLEELLGLSWTSHLLIPSHIESNS